MKDIKDDRLISNKSFSGGCGKGSWFFKLSILDWVAQIFLYLQERLLQMAEDQRIRGNAVRHHDVHP